MFYDKEQIDEHLKCIQCKQRYFEPKVLHCGESLCHFCIKNLYDEKNKGIDCPLCSSFHKSTSTDEFPTNKVLSKMLDIKSNEVYRSRSVKKLKESLENIKDDYENLVYNEENSFKTINEYFLFIHQNVQMIKNKNIEIINKYSEELKIEIDDYKNNCLKKVNNQNQVNLREEINDSKKEAVDFYSKWTSYLRKFQISDEEVDEACKHAILLKVKVKKLHKKMQFHLYNKQSIHFNINENATKFDLLGKIEYHQISTSYFNEINFKRINIIDIKNMITNKDSNDFSLYQINNNLLALAIQSQSDKIYNLSLSFIDNNEKVIKKFDNLTKTKPNSVNHKLTQSKIAGCGNKMALFCNFESQQGASQLFAFNLLSFEYQTAKIDAIINRMSCNTSSIICLTESGPQLGIEIYDWNLKFINKVGQEQNIELPFFIHATTKRMRISERNILLVDSKKNIHVINIDDGFLVRKFEIDVDDFIVFDEDAIVSFNKMGKLEFYDYMNDVKKAMDIEITRTSKSGKANLSNSYMESDDDNYYDDDNYEYEYCDFDHYFYDYENEEEEYEATKKSLSSRIQIINKSFDSDLLLFDTKSWKAHLYSCEF